jgi:hypothetical protein
VTVRGGRPLGLEPRPSCKAAGRAIIDATKKWLTTLLAAWS